MAMLFGISLIMDFFVVIREADHAFRTGFYLIPALVIGTLTMVAWLIVFSGWFEVYEQFFLLIGTGFVITNKTTNDWIGILTTPFTRLFILEGKYKTQDWDDEPDI